MQPMRTEQDAVNRDSKEKLDKVTQMKQQCASVRKSLKKYLRGHVFKLQKIRIDRHLRSCAVCRSEFDALKRAEETRIFLKDITPAEDLASRLKEGLSALAPLKKVFYRPLWMAGIILVGAIIHHYAVMPRQLDIELENIVNTTPTNTLPGATVNAAVVAAPSVTALSPAPMPAVTPPAPPVAALVVTMTAENVQAAVRRVNEVMRGHAQLRNKRFSDEVREISGALTAKELLTFFSRIEPAGKVSYSRTRFDSFPSAQPIPFVLRLKESPKAIASSPSHAGPVQKPSEAMAPVSAAPATAPTSSPVQ